MDNADELAILLLIQRWIVLRDNGEWDRLRRIWHDDGQMMAAWRHGTADEFIAGSKAGWGKGLAVFHALGAVAIDGNGHRAVSQNKMTISARGLLDGVLCETQCMSRHLDRWERREGRWGLVLRETIYDRDRLFPVKSGETLLLDPALLDAFPEAYRGMGYLLSAMGYPVSRELPVFGSALEAERIAAASAWLEHAQHG